MLCCENDHITQETDILKLIYFTYLHYTMSCRRNNLLENVDRKKYLTLKTNHYHDVRH
jgi:hypothetical protein